MKIQTTWGEANRRAWDFGILCRELGLNEWAMAEGLADAGTTLIVEEEVARRHGLLEPHNEETSK